MSQLRKQKHEICNNAGRRYRFACSGLPGLQMVGIAMKKRFFFLPIFVIILGSLVSAFLPRMLYRETQIIYYPGINQTRCHSVLDLIPEQYYEGVYSITFFNWKKYEIKNGTKVRIRGEYFMSTNIYEFDDCNLEVLVHELAHHCQIQKGDSKYLALQHKGHFEKCEEEIWEASHTLFKE